MKGSRKTKKPKSSVTRGGTYLGSGIDALRLALAHKNTLAVFRSLTARLKSSEPERRRELLVELLDEMVVQFARSRPHRVSQGLHSLKGRITKHLVALSNQDVDPDDPLSLLVTMAERLERIDQDAMTNTVPAKGVQAVLLTAIEQNEEALDWGCMLVNSDSAAIDRSPNSEAEPSEVISVFLGYLLIAGNGAKCLPAA